MQNSEDSLFYDCIKESFEIYKGENYKKKVKFAISILFEMVFHIMHFHTFTLSFFINIFLIKLTLRWQSYLKFKGSEATTEIANVDHLIKAGCGRFPFAIS